MFTVYAKTFNQYPRIYRFESYDEMIEFFNGPIMDEYCSLMVFDEDGRLNYIYNFVGQLWEAVYGYVV